MCSLHVVIINNSENDMDNWLAKRKDDVDSLHVEIEKTLMHASGVMLYKKYRLGDWLKSVDVDPHYLFDVFKELLEEKKDLRPWQIYARVRADEDRCGWKVRRSHKHGVASWWSSKIY